MTDRKTLTARIAAPLAALAAAVGFVAPQAASAGEDFRFKVEREDLTTSTGLKRTLKRIENFADATCNVSAARDLRSKLIAQDCAADVQRQIVDAVDHPQLSAAHDDGIFIARR
ncbi:MAG: UrcA family protein [Pseudomonadota bacterium]